MFTNKEDMFFNYDNNLYPIEKMPKEIDWDDYKYISSTTGLLTVFDAKNRPIGICAKYNTPFSLYFAVDGYIENNTITDLLTNSSIRFTVSDYWHKTIIDNQYGPGELELDNDTIKITLDHPDINKLKRETYYLNLSLIWPGGQCILYSEDNGFLTIK